jgi:hypothetical protein
MKVMLSSYPELLKEFKASDKSNGDKKDIIKKYYQITLGQ